MIKFEKSILPNGLQVIVHEDHSTPMAAVNILYHVGARDEHPDHTGFAHLFEHLMFEGSVHAPDFDDPLQRAGGESNAFTNNDITNYYDTLPAHNLEVALWLESDRMMALQIGQDKLDIQKKVVIEEFKEHYLNQPYGDIWHRLSKLAYHVHPYQWPTIGKDPSHIEQASLQDVSAFFKKFYTPNNATLVIAGPIEPLVGFELAEKWFGEISKGDDIHRLYPQEPEQRSPRFEHAVMDVPVSVLFKTWHMGDRLSENYYAMDLLTDVLAGSKSSWLYQHLVKDQRVFSELDAYVTGSMDAGLLIFEGKLAQGISLDQAHEALEAELKKLLHQGVTAQDLEKVLHKQEAQLVFQEISLLNRAMNLAAWNVLSDPKDANAEVDRYRRITAPLLKEHLNRVVRPENCCTLFYESRS